MFGSLDKLTELAGDIKKMDPDKFWHRVFTAVLLARGIPPVNTPEIAIRVMNDLKMTESEKKK